ncbi:MAG: type I-U CRISPR-associated protein Csb2 [Gammaproteobacteria bacterium]|nr:type I-U CRISPR-associated protein Csb2 [Gammaproteobacteria bacterium]MDE0432661.1 type I-U CRISPR-associated protein Csb2 [Bryobacterales bacterium]
MPVSTAFRFVAGRYHATPYGHHVNEGLIEWPPSPWRLLRALISVGYTSGAWGGVEPPNPARNLIEKLASELPRYFLPPAVGTHSRHYMPLGVLDSNTKLEKTTLVFDTWAQVEDTELKVTWPNVHLDDAEQSAFDTLVTRMNYLGRSESWVVGRVVEEVKAEINCFPHGLGVAPGRGWEQVALLAPTNAPEFDEWRAARLDAALADLPLPEGRKPAKGRLSKRAKATASYPADLLDCLQKDTTWLRSYGWNSPPGSRLVLYWRPSGAISTSARATRAAVPLEQRVQAMLLSLTNASRNDHTLPPVTRTLPQAELLHRALVAIAARKGTPPPEITGRDGNRRPRQGPHQHAHINPLDLDGDGHLDHVLVWAPEGLGSNAQAAIRSARTTFAKGVAEPLRLALAATGDLRDLVRLPEPYGARIDHLVGRATSWQSITPFVPPRYVKARGKNSLQGQIRAELRSRGFPDPTVTYPVAPTTRDVDRTRPFRHFKVVRQSGPQPPVASGYAIRIEFESPVSGPIAIGYGSHFGLGLFRAATST